MWLESLRETFRGRGNTSLASSRLLIVVLVATD